MDWSGSGETPTGTARAEAPGLSEAREKAEAVPVESEPAVAEIRALQESTNIKSKSTRVNKEKFIISWT